MAILKASEIRELNQKELESKLKDLRSELSRERAHVSSGTRPENPGRLRIIRRTIARILTINKEEPKAVVKKETKTTTAKVKIKEKATKTKTEEKPAVKKTTAKKETAPAKKVKTADKAKVAKKESTASTKKVKEEKK
ncbi:MAG: 50S ribosomal protein L29 [Candidatus Diapherotrites archaeon]|nr:50S ribosomal protein L29 [Candidatus Diapherotrites archaeon]